MPNLTLRQILIVSLAALATTAIDAATPDLWIRPSSANTSGPLIWGRTDGIVFGLPSPGGMPGPRGLIRVGIPDPSSTAPKLINFIAVEPVTTGTGPRHTRMAFSELEPSTLDPSKNGKRLWTTDRAGELTTGLDEKLSVRIEVEPFTANHAHVYVVASIAASHPDELQLAVFHHNDSAPIEQLTVTATMGNYERLRNLWLKDQIISSLDLYAGYQGNDFTEKEPYPLRRMITKPDGDAVVYATTNEADPSSVPVTSRPSWTYKAPKLTQYWRVPKPDVQPDLHVRVNGRRVYWLSQTPLPGGIAFENFEVRQTYQPGQMFVFGLTTQSPSP